MIHERLFIFVNIKYNTFNILQHLGERDWKFLNYSPCPLKRLREYYKKYPKLVLNQAGQSEVDEDYNTASSPIIVRKYGTPLSKINDNENEIQVNT